MIRLVAGAALALIFCAGSASAAKPAAAGQSTAFCKTLKGEWVGFGEEDTRKEAQTRLDTAIGEWKERYSLAKAKPKNRKVGCAVYIPALGEYLCTAQAEMCR